MDDSSNRVGPSGLQWTRINQQELDRVLRLHERFLAGQVNGQRALICPLQSGPKVNLDWTLKETEHGQEARA